jgi:hypothetical protein
MAGRVGLEKDFIRARMSFLEHLRIIAKRGQTDFGYPNGSFYIKMNRY